MISGVKTLASAFTSFKRSFSPWHKAEALERLVTLHLLNPDFQKKTITKDLKDHFISLSSVLDQGRLGFVYKTCLKLVCICFKIFNRKSYLLIQLEQLDQLTQALRQKNVEILNYKTKNSSFLDLSCYQKSPFLSQTIKLGLLELEKFQLNLYLSDLQKAKKGLDKPNLSQEEALQILQELPLFLQGKILKLSAPIEPKGFSSCLSLQEIFIKNPNARKIVDDLEASLSDRIDYLEEQVVEKKLKFLEKDVIFDENNGLTTESYVIDCSTNTIESTTPSKNLQYPLHIAMVAVEYAGLVKEGGLAEAVEGLSKALRAHHASNKVTLVYPKFSNLPKGILAKLKDPAVFKSAHTEYKVYSLEIDDVEIKLIDHPLFKLEKGCNSIYGPTDEKQQERFAIFNALATDYLLESVKPQLIHLHDWHAAGILAKIKKDHKHAWENGDIPPVVFTFHNNNRASQGRTGSSPYSYEKVIKGYVKSGILSRNENLFVKTLQDADMVTTVSETFAKEAQQLKYGEGISFAVRAAAKEGRLFGIINGTNPYRWNPETDGVLKTWKDLRTGQLLDLSYSPETLNIVEKKLEIKNQLKLWVDKYLVQGEKRRIVFDFTKPFVTYVGRYDSYQKGLDKLEEAIESTLQSGGQFICMGMGEDSEAKKILDRLEKKYKKGVLFLRDFKDAEGKIYYQQGNETRPGIGSLIRACSEFTFIPSRFEPCGLVQFEGWLFGSLAIGSKTGGLADTIKPHKDDSKTFNGFLFCREAENDISCSQAIKQALTLWSNYSTEKQNLLIKRIIAEGRKYGWDSSPSGHTPLEKYTYVYDAAIKASKKRYMPKKTLASFQQINLLPFAPAAETTKAEENYLYHYYNAEKLQTSIETLKTLFNKIPTASPNQLPSPFGKDINFKQYKVFGGHLNPKTGLTSFKVSAPSAKSVSLQLFDEHDNLLTEYAMKKSADGDWGLTNIKDLVASQRYLYKIDDRLKCDPFSKGIVPSKLSTSTCYSILTEEKHVWGDKLWMQNRTKYAETKKPLNIYEIHPTTWKKKPDGSFLNYREMAVELVKHAKACGFSHIELMGILEHPYEGSWGYQPTGYFAPNHRMGSIDDFKFMINYLHNHNIGAILDFIPGHFASDDFGLKKFDGTAMYEPRKIDQILSLRYWFYHYGANHFDFTKKENRNFLISSAHYWLKELHLDGLRIDCVSGILRSEDPASAKNFIRDLNAIIHQETPGAISIAEDFSGNPLILADPSHKGLGFDYRWNTAWNHFALKYFTRKQLRPAASHYNFIKSAITQHEQESQIAFFSHDETNKERGAFLETLRSLPPHKQIARIKSFLSFLMISNRSHLLFSGLEQLNLNPWDAWIGKKESFISSDISDEKAQQIKKMLQVIADLKLGEKAFALDTVDTKKMIDEDPAYAIHAYRKSYDDSSVVILHNLTEEDKKTYTIRRQKSEGKTIHPKEIFFSQDDFSSETSKPNHLLDIKDEGDFVAYTVAVPAESTIIIKEY